MKAAALALLFMFVLACGGDSGHTLRGEFTLTTLDKQINASGCFGTGGFADIGPAAQVVVKDDSGKVIGTTQLGTGKFVSTSCVFNFVVEGLPKVAFYSIEVSQRGALTYSFADLEDRGWSVSLTLE